MTDPDPDRPRFRGPLDDADPRFTEAPRRSTHPRELVTARGPFPDPESPGARFARFGIPAITVAGLVAIAIVFIAGLDPGSGVQRIGRAQDVRAAVADRPRRTCYEGALPCAWLTMHDGRLIALNTSGPLPGEFGREGVGWCPTSGGFGANATGSRYDAAGRVVRGPSPRGLDRYHLTVDGGVVSIDFFSLQTGPQVGRVDDLVPAAGPDCATIPFDWDADLELGGR